MMHIINLLKPVFYQILVSEQATLRPGQGCEEAAASQFT